jgi:predicted nucleic acid-binding protein
LPVVDASVVVDWVAPGADPQSAAVGALRRLARDEAELLAPRLLLEEVANALLTGVRRSRWTGTDADADAAHRVLRDLPVRIVDESGDLDRAWELARRHNNHPIYEMLYVALAERRTTLVTADDALRRRLAGLDWVLAPEALA